MIIVAILRPNWWTNKLTTDWYADVWEMILTAKWLTAVHPIRRQIQPPIDLYK